MLRHAAMRAADAVFRHERRAAALRHTLLLLCYMIRYMLLYYAVVADAGLPRCYAMAYCRVFR